MGKVGPSRAGFRAVLGSAGHLGDPFPLIDSVWKCGDRKRHGGALGCDLWAPRLHHQVGRAGSPPQREGPEFYSDYGTRAASPHSHACTSCHTDRSWPVGSQRAQSQVSVCPDPWLWEGTEPGENVSLEVAGFWWGRVGGWGVLKSQR